MGIFALTYLLFKSKKISLIASLIYAISPFTVFFDSMALVDSMLSMFGIWTLIFAILALLYLRYDFAILAGFTLGGALLTKSPGIYFIALIISVWILSKWPKDKKKIVVYLFKLISLTVVTLIISFAMYNILRLGPNFQMIAIRNKDYVYPISHLLERPFDPLIPFLNKAFEWFWILGPSVFVILIVLGAIISFKNYKKEVILLLIWALAPLIISAEFAKVFTARYIMFLLPYFAILAALVFLQSRFQKIIIFIFVFFIIHALWLNYKISTDIQNAPLPTSERTGYLEEWTAGTGIREVSDYLKSEWRSNPKQKIVVGTEGYFGTLPDGLQMYLANYPEITVIGVGLDIQELPKSLKESKEAGNKTFLVINSTRLKGDPQKLGLTLIAAYPKAFRTLGTRDYSLYGPRETLYFFEVTKSK